MSEEKIALFSRATEYLVREFLEAAGAEADIQIVVEAAGEPPVDIVQARTMGEAWEKAPACPDEP